MREELGKFRDIKEVIDMRGVEHLRDIQWLQRGREAEINVLKDDLVGCDALILDPQENIKFLKGDINTSKM